MDEFKLQLDKLSEKLTESNKKIEELLHDKNNITNQLKEPLDTVSSQTINNLITIPVVVNFLGTSAATLANYDLFFIADRSYIVTSVSAIFKTKSTDAGAVPLDIYRGINGTTGVSILAEQIDLKGANNTVQNVKLVNNSNVELKKGDPLTFVMFGTPTGLVQLVVVVNLRQK